MGYSVEYNPELRKNYPQKRENMPKIQMKWLLMGVIICVGIYILFGTGFIKLFIPGDPEITVAAFSDMVQRVSTGEPVTEAVFGFVRDVVVMGMD